MAKSPHVSGNNAAAVVGVNSYYVAANGYNGPGDTTEAFAQIPYRSAGTFTSLRVRVSANDTAAKAWTLRVNGSSTSLSASITGSGTGTFSDTTNSATISAGDLVDYLYDVLGAVPTASNIIIKTSNVTFNASVNTVTRYVNKSTLAGYSADSTASYFALAGQNTTVLPTEAQMNVQLNAVGTLKNLAVYVSSNARVTTTTIRQRKNTAFGNMTISVTTLATGLFEDNSNTETVAVDDVFCYRMDTGVGGGTIVLKIPGASEFVAGSAMHFANGETGDVVGASTTWWEAAGGGLASQTTEANATVTIDVPGTASNLYQQIYSNSRSDATTVTLQKNGSGTSVAVSVSGGSTGAVEDTTNTAVYVATDTVSYKLVTGGGTGTIAWTTRSMLLTTFDPATTAAFLAVQNAPYMERYNVVSF